MWNHNYHFHDYLLRQCPIGARRALDVGCGLGIFAQRLAQRVEVVDALDVDGAILSEASGRNASANIRYLHADFLKADLLEASYDVVVAIASVHHMDLQGALAKMKVLLRPSGTLIILGLYREAKIADYIYSAVSVPLNLLYLSWHHSSATAPAFVPPTRPADLSLDRISAAAHSLLPGFCLRRHLFWRYSLIWHKL